MSDKPISPLRQRMIDDMTARRFGEDTQRDYVRHVRNFTAFLGRSPDTATSEDLRRYQLHLAKQQISPGSINAAGTALRFFSSRSRSNGLLTSSGIWRPYSGRARGAGGALSEEEVARLPRIRAQPQGTKAALCVAYGAGLRVSEVANLKVSGYR